MGIFKKKLNMDISLEGKLVVVHSTKYNTLMSKLADNLNTLRTASNVIFFVKSTHSLLEEHKEA